MKEVAKEHGIKLSKDAIAEIKKDFKKIDNDGNGSISPSELVAAIKSKQNDIKYILLKTLLKVRHFNLIISEYFSF